MVCPVARVFGLRCSAGRERVNQSEIAGRVAERIRAGRSVVRDAVEAVDAAMRRTLYRLTIPLVRASPSHVFGGGERRPG